MRGLHLIAVGLLLAATLIFRGSNFEIVTNQSVLDDRRRLLLRRVRGLAALSQNDPGKSNGLMDMDAASKVKSPSDVSTWHAMTADEVIRRLNTNATKGLDAGEVASRLQKYGSNRLPEGTKRGPFMRFLSQFNNILVYVLLGAGFTKLMLNLWLDASDYLRRGRPERAARLHPGGSGGESSGFNPKHACPLRRGLCAAVRRA